MTPHGNTVRRVLLGTLCLIAPLNAIAGDAWNFKTGCFSMVVGKKASADGSVMFAHNEDAAAPAVNLYKVPAGAHTVGEQGSYPYLWLNVTTCDMCATYLNEYGVIVGSDACPSREDKPELTNGGILFWLRRLAVERARTAREAVKIAGGLISELGYADGGRSYIIADPNEAWILAAVNGKHWVAARVPDDKVVAIPNCYTIQGINLRDTLNFLGSPDIIDHAIKKGWYDPAKDGEFNFARVYSPAGSIMHPANAGRMWRGIDLVAGKKYDIKQQLPFAVTPARKVTVQDLMRTMSDRYDGTEIEEPGQAAICHDGTMYSFVAHLRPWLPAAIRSVLWVALYHPDLQAYSAWYPSIESVPEAYAVGDHVLGLQEQLDRSIEGHKKERSPAYATFVSLDEKARAGSSANVPRVRLAWKSYQEKVIEEQGEFEKKVMKLKEQESGKAVELITKQTASKAAEICREAEELIKALD